MAKRSIRRKQANRLRKALRASPATMIDLVQYLKDRRYAQTTGEAEKIILDGRVRSESHKLGITKGRKIKDSSILKARMGRELVEEDWEVVDAVQRLVPASYRDTIQVIAA